MNADVRKTRSHVASKLIAAIAAFSILTGCDDGPTAPRPASNIAGSWRGSVHPGIGPGFDPCVQSSSAAATITQDGFRVSGTVTTESVNFSGGALEGEFREGQLRGTLTNSGETITVTGSATISHLTIIFYSPGHCGPNSIELER
jgi:hypothetical protein